MQDSFAFNDHRSCSGNTFFLHGLLLRLSLLLLPLNLLLLRRLLLLSKRLSLGRSPLHSQNWALWTLQSLLSSNQYIHQLGQDVLELILWMFIMNYPYKLVKNYRITSIYRSLSIRTSSFSSSSRSLIIAKQWSWTDCSSRICLKESSRDLVTHCIALFIIQLLSVSQHLVCSLYVLVLALQLIRYWAQHIAPNLVVIVQPFFMRHSLISDWTG